MSTNRNVTVTIGAQTAPGANQAINALASSASGLNQRYREAKEAIDKLGQAQKDLYARTGGLGVAFTSATKAIESQTRATLEAAAADRLFATNKGAVAAQIEREVAAAAKLKALNQARAEAGLPGHGGGGVDSLLGSLASRFLGPLALVGGFSKASSGIQNANNGGPFGQGYFNQRGSYSDSATSMAANIPFLGNFWRSSTAYRDLERRQQAVQDSRLRVGETEQTFGVRRPLLEQQRGLGIFGDSTADRLGLGAGASAISAETAIQFRRGSEAEQVAARGSSGVSASQQRGDIAGQYRYGEQSAQLRISQQRESVQAERDRQRAIDEVAQRQTALNQLKRQELDLEAARKGAKTEAGYLIATNQLAEHRVRLAQAQQDLLESQDRSMQAQAQHGQTLLAQSQQRLTLLQQERERQAGIVEQERERKDSQQVQFGLQSTTDRRAALQVARKIAGGGDLTERELRFAQGQGDLFRPAVEAQARKRSGPEFDEIRRLLGTDQRAQQAAAKQIQLENQIRIEVNVAEKAVEDAVQKQITPAIQQLMQTVQQTLQTAMQRLQAEQQANRQAVN